MSTRDDAAARRHTLVLIGGERFAIPAERVEDVIPESALRRLGAMPAHVPGVIRYEGRWIPAVDPAPLLGFRGSRPGQAAVLHRGTQPYALLIDGAAGAIMIPEDEIEFEPDAMGGSRKVYEDAAGAVILLDVDALFHTPAPRQPNGLAFGRHAAPDARVVLAFRVGRFRLALAAECVLEVRTLDGTSGPASVRGATGATVAYDGRDIPLISLSHRLNAIAARHTHVLIVTSAQEPIAIGVEAIRGVFSVPIAHAGAGSDLLRRLLPRCVRGVLRTDAGPMAELDVAELTAMAGSDEAAAAASPTRI